MKARTLVTLLTSSFLSISSFAVNCNVTQKHVGVMGAAPLITSDASLLYSTPVEEAFYQREGITKPTSYSSIFYQSADYSAQVIEKNANKSYGYWTSTNETDLTRYGIPSDILKDLNVQAHQVWTALLSCNNGSAESLRKNYFKNTYCLDVNVGKEVSQQLSLLSRSLYSFLTSGPLFVDTPNKALLNQLLQKREAEASESCKDPSWLYVGKRKATYEECLQTMSYASYDDRQEYASYQPQLPTDIKIKNIHPLLAQLVIEYYNILFQAPWEKYTLYTHPVINEKLINGMLVSGGDIDIFNRTFRQSLIEAVTLVTGKGIDTVAISNMLGIAKSGINLHILMYAMTSGSEDNGCSVFGFWPAMNSVIGHIYGDRFSMRFSSNSKLLQYEKEISKATSNICRMRPASFASSTDYAVFSQYSLFHNVELKRVFMGHPETTQQIKLPMPLQIINEESLTPSEKLLCK